MSLPICHCADLRTLSSLTWAVMLQGHGMGRGGSYCLAQRRTLVLPPLSPGGAFPHCLLHPPFLMGLGLVKVGSVWGEPRGKREHLP